MSPHIALPLDVTPLQRKQVYSENCVKMRFFLCRGKCETRHLTGFLRLLNTEYTTSVLVKTLIGTAIAFINWWILICFVEFIIFEVNVIWFFIKLNNIYFSIAIIWQKTAANNFKIYKVMVTKYLIEEKRNY